MFALSLSNLPNNRSLYRMCNKELLCNLSLLHKRFRLNISDVERTTQTGPNLEKKLSTQIPSNSIQKIFWPDHDPKFENPDRISRSLGSVWIGTGSSLEGDLHNCFIWICEQFIKIEFGNDHNYSTESSVGAKDRSNGVVSFCKNIRIY